MRDLEPLRPGVPADLELRVGSRPDPGPHAGRYWELVAPELPGKERVRMRLHLLAPEVVSAPFDAEIEPRQIEMARLMSEQTKRR